MITAVRRLQFSAGHRVFGHESKCANLHGHNYVVFIHARANDLDAIGRVIDFSVLKTKFGDWIDRYWDHGFLYSAEDLAIDSIKDREGVNSLKWFKCPFNPTAEMMAFYLLRSIAPGLLKDTGVVVHRIVLWETENCYAEVVL